MPFETPRMSASPALRFAPSPNGFLHLGHAYSALMNARIAARLGGTLHLRFEDIDTARCRPDYATEAMADLAWLGITWQEPVWYQSSRFPVYKAALARLEAENLLYPCFCSRGDIARAVADRSGWPRDPDGAPLYPGTCRGLSASERGARRSAGLQPALRLDMAAAQPRAGALFWTEFEEDVAPVRIRGAPAAWGDALLARKDVPTSYHLSVVVDDAAQGITDVVRGADLRAATSLHRLLQHLLDLPEPAYHHHSLIRDDGGGKLAKSHGAPALRDMRFRGADPDVIRRRLGFSPRPCLVSPAVKQSLP